MRSALLLFAAGCSPSVAALSADHHHGELACRMSNERDIGAAAEALIAAAHPRVRVNAYVLEGPEAKDLAEHAFVAVETRTTGFAEAHDDLRASIEPAVDVMEDRYVSRGLYTLTGEKELEAKTVEVSTTSIDGENAKWALVTLGLSVLAGKQVFDTRVHEETHVPSDGERARAAPRAMEIATFLRARIPNAAWFAVKKSDLATAKLELTLLVMPSEKPCTAKIVLETPLAIVLGVFTGEFREVREWKTLDASRDGGHASLER